MTQRRRVSQVEKMQRVQKRDWGKTSLIAAIIGFAFLFLPFVVWLSVVPLCLALAGGTRALGLSRNKGLPERAAQGANLNQSRGMAITGVVLALLGLLLYASHLAWACTALY